jgi:hypothetical protein
VAALWPFADDVREHRRTPLWTVERSGSSIGLRAVFDVRRVLGMDHPHTLITQNKLARVLRKLGRVDEARQEYEEVVASRKRF